MLIQAPQAPSKSCTCCSDCCWCCISWCCIGDVNHTIGSPLKSITLFSVQQPDLLAQLPKPCQCWSCAASRTSRDRSKQLTQDYSQKIALRSCVQKSCTCCSCVTLSMLEKFHCTLFSCQKQIGKSVLFVNPKPQDLSCHAQNSCS